MTSIHAQTASRFIWTPSKLAASIAMADKQIARCRELIDAAGTDRERINSTHMLASFEDRKRWLCSLEGQS